MENKFFAAAIFLIFGIFMVTSHLNFAIAADPESSDDNGGDDKGSDDNNDKQESKSNDDNEDDNEDDKQQSSDNDHDDCDKIRPGWNKNYYANKCRHDND